MDQFFLTIHNWMSSGTGMAALGCFAWGVVSVLFSPCHLASIPLIVGYVGGQNKLIEGRQAAFYALLFTAGLFASIAAIGSICAVLGRMLGDIGPYYSIGVGLILIWVGMDMLGIAHFSVSGNLMSRLRVRGASGAFILGLAYGVLSGSCTFGFIAPILAIITVQQKIVTGLLLIVIFGLGHCIPIAIAGSSTALVKRMLASSSWQKSGLVFRRIAGAVVICMGFYFLIRPWIITV